MYMPWLLNGASPQTLEAVLGKFPPPLLTAFREPGTQRYDGLGLGLAIVKEFMTMHGGNVSAESAGSGQGAAFILQFPLAD